MGFGSRGSGPPGAGATGTGGLEPGVFVLGPRYPPAQPSHQPAPHLARPPCGVPPDCGPLIETERCPGAQTVPDGTVLGPPGPGCLLRPCLPSTEAALTR